jgi:hypothetical protein
MFTANVFTQAQFNEKIASGFYTILQVLKQTATYDVYRIEYINSESKSATILATVYKYQQP